jgi:hypothetical protein
MNRPQIIGLAGPKGCGKDTVAMLLATHARFRMLAFADALRGQLCEAFGVNGELFTRRDMKDEPTPALALIHCKDNAFGGVMMMHLRGPELDAQLQAPRSPRQLMKWWANEYRRETESPDYWRRIVVSHIAMDHKQHQWRHVIHDVRFPNEVEVIRNMGGVIWQIKRPGCEADPTDLTETSGAEFEPAVVIDNCGSVRHLLDLVMGHWFTEETGLHWTHLGTMFSTIGKSQGARP